MRTFITLCVVAITMVSCMPTKTIYYYSAAYDAAYYDYVKNPGSESEIAYIQALQDMISKTESRKSLKIGPGVYAEYGYFLLQHGREEESKTYFEKEREAFPESQTIVNFITQSDE